MRKPLFKFETKVNLMFHKYYFESGYALLSYLRYIILFIGLDNIIKGGLQNALYLGISYALLCYFVGYLFVKSDFAKAQNEVSNRINLLAIELRKNMKNGNK